MLSQRQIRWYEFLSRFDFKLAYRAGKNLVNLIYFQDIVIIYLLITLAPFLVVLLTVLIVRKIL